MISFMDYVVREFGTTTDWNYDNSYSFLTATSDALLSFQPPSAITLHVSSLSTANFATSYTLSALGQLDGSISYLYTNFPLDGVASRSTETPLQRLCPGYRDVPLPIRLEELDNVAKKSQAFPKPTLLHATLALPPPSALTALYARRIDNETLLSVFLNSRKVLTPATGSPPPASVLAHLQRDTGRYSIEGLGSTDSALLGVRGLWNFGLGPPEITGTELEDLTLLGGSPDLPLDIDAINRLSPYYVRLAQKPSLLSAGAEFYYSPFSHVIGLSTGLRFTTMASHIATGDPSLAGLKSFKPLAGTSAAFTSSFLTPSNISQSSFPYTMTLTLNPLIGSLASTYSVKPTSNLALSSRFDFNVYSWESQYVFGAEIWRRRRRSSKDKLDSDGNIIEADPMAWARNKTLDWFSPAERALKDQRLDREEENVINLRIDDGWNIKALWTGRVKSLLVSAGVSLSPLNIGRSSVQGRNPAHLMADEDGRRKRWTGTFGVSISYST